MVFLLHRAIIHCGRKLNIYLTYKATIPQQDIFTSVKNTVLHKDLYLNHHNSYVHNPPKLEIIQTATAE